MSKSTHIRFRRIFSASDGEFIRNRISTITSNVCCRWEREDMLTATQGWERPFKGNTDEALAKILPKVLQTRRWFGGKARRIETIRVVESIAIPAGSTTTLLLI